MYGVTSGDVGMRRSEGRTRRPYGALPERSAMTIAGSPPGTFEDVVSVASPRMLVGGDLAQDWAVRERLLAGGQLAGEAIREAGVATRLGHLS